VDSLHLIPSRTKRGKPEWPWLPLGPGCKAEHPSRSSAAVYNCIVTQPLPKCIYGIVLNCVINIGLHLPVIIRALCSHTKFMCQSESRFTADSQSVCLGVEPTSSTFDQILLPFQQFGCGMCCLVSVGRPLWREAWCVVCKSQSSHLSVCTFTIYMFVFHTFTMYIYIYIYIYIYTRPLSVPARYSRLCPTSSSSDNGSLDSL
jgi:hypothetical protein